LKEILSKNEDVISHFYNIPNTKVIDLLKSSHVCLLPTYADTYGFTVLEAQAAGCPVISTDIRALPEINNEEVGWLINIPKNDFRNAKLITKSERENLSKMIKLQLSEILIQILSNPESLKIKGVNSIDRIRNEHSFSNTTHQIETIYDTIKGNI
jgi:glycosyltransferase involved in cell wall biosynthesis